MKRGYKKLLLFEIIIFIILILNSFVWNILSSYKISIFLLVVLFMFKGIFGFEKDRHRYTKDIILEVLIFLLVFFILYYLSGIIISFYETGNYYTFDGLVKVILPIIIYISLREYLRYMFMCKAEGSKTLFCTTTILFILLDITTAIYARNFSSNYTTFLFVAITLLPAISLNVVFSYFTTRVGYKPLLIYSLIIGTYFYFIPIVPNPNEYISSIINFILPIALGYRIYKVLNKYTERSVTPEYRKRHFVPLIVSGLVVLVLVYFTSGYFHYWAIAVASGSMQPKINKGDVAIVEKLDGNFESLEEGQVIAFKYSDVIIVHRLVNIIEEKGEYYFYTKGDANRNQDNYVVREKMIVGKVNHRIPYVGIPTVWVNELF